jgi:signal transduction histidine kinase
MNDAIVAILLVEDSHSDAVLLQESLLEGHGQGDSGFRFTRTESWAEAAVLLQKRSFDVLLLDLSLPDSSGRETFVRARAAAPHLPIVVLTGEADEAVGLEAVRHGVQDYLIKGQAYGRQTARAIRYAIERKQTESALMRAEADLQRERDQLEARVRKRTAELSQANRALLAEVAQRERAEAAHSEVLRSLAAAEETERGRVSRELHDRLGQDLTALKLGLQVACKQGSCSPSVRTSINKLEALADNLLRDIHRLAWELRPTALDDFGLEMALRRYADEWAALSGVPVDFHSQGVAPRRLALELETTLYRIAREALTNVFRHAHASRVSVLLERRPDHVSLIVEDNGQGFDGAATIKQSAPLGKLGLLGMRERATLARGSVVIESNPGVGTTVFARLPLAFEPAPNPPGATSRKTRARKR